MSPTPSQPTLDHDWGFKTELGELRDVRCHYREPNWSAGVRQRTRRSCSVARPADYDSWAAAWGTPGWSYDELLPTFRAVEADRDASDQVWHGAGRAHPGMATGPRGCPDTPLQRAFAQAALAMGHAWVTDLNHPDAAAGVGLQPRATCTRASSA